ncbi:MAG: hypothetical protein ACREVA_10935, partial [Burkholderiales bacterium]
TVLDVQVRAAGTEQPAHWTLLFRANGIANSMIKILNRQVRKGRQGKTTYFFKIYFASLVSFAVKAFK